MDQSAASGVSDEFWDGLPEDVKADVLRQALITGRAPGDLLVSAWREYVDERCGRREPKRVVTTPFDDPIVQACIDNGGHFWPEDAPDDEPATCTRCWFNPGWKAGKPRDESNVRPIRDEPRAD